MKKIRWLAKTHDLGTVNQAIGEGWFILCMIEDERRGYGPTFVLASEEGNAFFKTDPQGFLETTLKPAGME